MSDSNFKKQAFVWTPLDLESAGRMNIFPLKLQASYSWHEPAGSRILEP